MRSQNHPIILFIDRTGFTLFQDTLTNIPRFNFTPDLVANLDVVSKEQFSKLIESFIQINKIAPSSLGVLLSDNVIYIKDLAKEGDSQEEIQAFLENIPFEEVLAKVIKTETVNRVVATNKDLVMTIVNAFVHKGSSLEFITPSFMCGSNVNFTAGLTQENIKSILGNLEILKIGNLLTDQQKIILPQVPESEKISKENGVKKPQGLRQYILIGVFVTLLVIFVVVYLNLGASKTPPPKKLKNSTTNSVVAPTTIPTLTEALATAAPDDLKSIQIKIVQSPQSGIVIDGIKNNLLSAGFENIVNEVSQGSEPSKSSMVFSQNISPSVQDIVIGEVKKTLPDVAVSSVPEANLTIVIIVGRS